MTLVSWTTPPLVVQYAGESGKADQRRDRARVDDVRPAGRPAQVGRGELGRQPRRAQVRLVDGVPDVLGQGVDCAARGQVALDDPRVVHQHVERAERSTVVSTIASIWSRSRRSHSIASASAPGRARELRRLRRGRAVAVDDGDGAGPPARHLHDDGAAEALPGARDDRDLAVEHGYADPRMAAARVRASAIASPAARPSAIACDALRGTSASPITRTVPAPGTSALQSRATRSPTTMTVSAGTRSVAAGHRVPQRPRRPRRGRRAP